jgi:hypothetical protein
VLSDTSGERAEAPAAASELPDGGRPGYTSFSEAQGDEAAALSVSVS